MIAWLLLLAAPEPIALRLEEVGELPLARGIEIANALSEAIEAKSGRPAVIDEPSWACDSPDRCVAEIAARTHATSVVLLRVYGGATLIHLRAERVDGPPKLDLDLREDGSGWASALAAAAKTLFPEAAIVTMVPEPKPPELEPALPIQPILLLASAAVLTGVGVGFGVSSRGAGDDIAAEPLHGSRYQALADRQETHGIVADLCFVGAGSALIGAVLTWLVSDP